MANTNEIGDRIRKLRHAQNIFRREVAPRVEVDYTSVNKVETGKLAFGEYTADALIQRLADAIRADEEKLLILAHGSSDRDWKRVLKRPEVFIAFDGWNDRSLDKVISQIAPSRSQGFIHDEKRPPPNIREYGPKSGDRQMNRPARALSIRQPWAELILRGIKSIEVRSLRTNIRERFHIYASLGRVDADIEAEIASMYAIDIDSLPRGVLVGTVELIDCRPLKRADSDLVGFRLTTTEGLFAWDLARPERADRLRKPKGKPQPVWFHPF